MYLIGLDKLDRVFFDDISKKGHFNAADRNIHKNGYFWS